jgi:hypothetical protein
VSAIVARLRSEPCETGGLLAVMLVKFRHFDEHGDGGERADAENAGISRSVQRDRGGAQTSFQMFSSGD